VHDRPQRRQLLHHRAPVGQIRGRRRKNKERYPEATAAEKREVGGVRTRCRGCRR
jgi:hypothetical protein